MKGKKPLLLAVLVVALLAVGLIALQRGRAFLDPLHGWGLLGWLFVGGVSLLACLAAYRKWQAEQS